MKKVIVAMSGGVDSSYAAWLLKEQGYEVEGVCLDLYEGSKAPEEARLAGDWLGIRTHVADCRQRFREGVVDYFCRAYHAGFTPNPCALCNPSVKFASLMEAADRLGADGIATGHYARCSYDAATGKYWLLRGKDSKKDQSYFLYRLGQDVLRKMIFPLGDLTKEEVRTGAARAGFPAAAKRDSQDICFIPGNDYVGFLRLHDEGTGVGDGLIPGDFVDGQGNVLGRHKGLAFYTVGQRKNLGASFGERMFVLSLWPEGNQVVVGPEEALYTREVYTMENCFISGEGSRQPMQVAAKLRSGAVPAPAIFYPAGAGEGRLVFEAAQRAAAPGQCAVYYDGERVLGGGIIQRRT